MATAGRPRPRARVRASADVSATASSSSLAPIPAGARGSVSPAKAKADRDKDDLFADRRAIFQGSSTDHHRATSPSTRSSLSPEIQVSTQPRGPKSKDIWQAPAWADEEAAKRRKRKLEKSKGKERARAGSKDVGGSSGSEDDGDGSVVDAGRKRRKMTTPPREKSLTPPPPVDRFQLDVARASILQSRVYAQPLYNPLVHSHSPGMALEEEDEFEEFIEVDKEDERMQALLAKSRARLAARNGNFEDPIMPIASGSGSGSGSGSARPVGLGQVGRSGSGGDIDQGLPVELSVAMRADPDSIALQANRSALEAYEKRHSFKMYSKQPLLPIYEAMSARTGRRVQDLVLVYEGSQIMSSHFSAAQLGIYGFAELDVYDAPVWNKVQARARAAEQERARRLAQRDQDSDRRPTIASKAGKRNGGVVYVNDDDEDDDFQVIGAAGPSFIPPAANPITALATAAGSKDTPVVQSLNEDDAEEGSDILHLTLRGDEGDLRVTAKPTTKISSLLSHYAQKKLGKMFEIPVPAPPPPPPPPKKGGRNRKVAPAPPQPPAQSPNGVHLIMSVEGDKLDPDSVIGDCDDIEDDTMLEVGRG